MTSIRRTLLLFLMGSLLFLAGIIVAFSYLITVHEMDELYDANMEQAARALGAHLVAVSRSVSDGTFDTALPQGAEKARLSEEEDFLIQVWDTAHRLDYSSHPHIPFPEQERAGFSRTVYEGYSWRVYVEETPHGRVQFSQPEHVRENLLREVMAPILLPLFLLFPLIVLVVWLSVGRGLRPLQNISHGLRQRDAFSLQPFEPGGVPSEIAPLVAELNALLERLGHALEAQRRFTADAAHELRTPLTALQLQLDLIRRAQTEAERKETLDRLQSGMARTKRLVSQLLDFTRLEPDRPTTLPAVVDLSLVVRDEIEAFAPEAMRRSIVFGASRFEPVSVRGIPAELQLLIRNLIDNALRYTADGGTVDIQVFSDTKDAILIVADDGVGIPKSDRSRVFERFYRVMGTKVSGTGLGLAMVRAVLDHHKGDIEVRDGLDNRGTAFIVRLPHALL